MAVSPLKSLRRLPLSLAAAAVLAATPAFTAAQETDAVVQTTADNLRVEGTTAYTWPEGSGDVLLLEGPVTITAGDAVLTSDAATIWLDTVDGAVTAQVALLGNAAAKTPQATRRGGQLLVRLNVRQGVRLVAEDRLMINADQSVIYTAAANLRQAVTGETPPVAEGPRRPARPRPVARESFSFNAESIETRPTEDGGTALILSDGVFMLRTAPNGDITELQGERAVLYTTLADLTEMADLQGEEAANAIESAYLEGDVRVRFTPAAVQPRVNRRVDRTLAEQSLEAERVFYDFKSDKAVLTEAVLRTIEPRLNLPVTVRAETLRQLSNGEFEAERAELSTSRFAVPDYSINASKIYVRTESTGNPELGDRTRFRADNLTVRAFGKPFIYLPRAGGSVDERNSPLEQIALEGSDNFGFGILTRWGVFETFGGDPPPGVDASYRLDYFTERGPAVGFDFSYQGGSINTAGDPTSFEGDITAYGVFDEGVDDLGSSRGKIEQDGFRGLALLEHQHYFASDWQGQLRIGVSSDETFIEEWYERTWRDGLPTNASFYAKRQRGTEALTVLAETPTTDFVTTSGQIQENFDVIRAPEVGYFRTADAIGDRATFFSENRIGGVQFEPSEADLVTDLGFSRSDPDADIDPRFPGVPGQGFTGVDDNYAGRLDFRQQFDLPLAAGPVKFVPYIVGRLTAYSDSPNDDNLFRFLGAAGVRLSMSLVKTDNTARSEFLDINRIRHIVEPHLHVFGSLASEDREDAPIYDTETDDYQALNALSVGVRQRWQTKRGAPGRERNVDFLVLNTSVDFFDEEEDYREVDSVLTNLTTDGFRGAFFETRPENSIPRDTFNADLLWRVSDTTVILADASHNIEEGALATGAIGFAAQRGQRLSYFVGVRYIGEINTAISTIYGTYALGDKYTLDGGITIDFSEGESRTIDIGINRNLDRLVIGFRAFFDEVDDEGGFRFTLFPKGIGYGIDTLDLQNATGRR
ncbi:MAG: hypothetical protein AAGD32_04500 [Planctomycetota bacterium]